MDEPPPTMNACMYTIAELILYLGNGIDDLLVVILAVDHSLIPPPVYGGFS